MENWTNWNLSFRCLYFLFLYSGWLSLFYLPIFNWLKSWWEICSPTQNQGMDLETWSTVKARLLMMVLQGVWWAGTPRAVETSNLFPNTQVPPNPGSSLAEYCGVYNLPGGHLSHYFLMGYPFFSLSNLYPQFSRRTFLLVYPFTQHLVCLGPSRCVNSVSSVSLGQFRARAQGMGGFLSLSNLPPQP